MSVRVPAIRSCAIIGLLLVSVAGFAGNSDIGKPTGGGAAIDWAIAISGYEQIQLTVAGPDGEISVREFPSGRVPSFRLLDLEDVVDGSYTWEMRVVPKIPTQVKNALANARAAGDEKASRRIMRDAGLDKPLVQSGTFTILNGSIVPPDAVEPGPQSSIHLSSRIESSNRPVSPLDNVVADDQIVTGSLCVGYDCVDGESFGFDTIRLKENNTRIGFDDTSATAGFAANDWQLEANESASGGASRFSILDVTGSKYPFVVTAGAPTNSLFVASNGKLGGRTSTPVLDLHLKTSDTPAIRLEQTNEGGWTAQTWDVAGNEANFFVRDVTSGSTLPFRIRPGAPTSSIDIAASGYVGVGTPTPASKLHVVPGNITLQNSTNLKTAPTIAALVRFTDSAGSEFGWFGDGSVGTNNMTLYAGTTHGLSLYSGGAVVLFAPVGGNVGLGGLTTPSYPLHHANGAYLTVGGVWTNASSRALKQDIQKLESTEAREALDHLDPVKFAYRADPSDENVGFIAEDVPELVATPDHSGLSPMDIVAVLTKVVKDQQQTIDELQARLKKLENEK